jgi:uncharacterized protein (DUF885 family)
MNTDNNGKEHKMRSILAILIIIVSMQSLSFGSKKEIKSSATDRHFKRVHDAYVIGFLKRNPTVNTYVGGAGLDPSLREVDGMLRDHSVAALKAEDQWLTSTMKAFEAIDPKELSPNLRIDRNVALAQIRFLLHQHKVRKYQQRALDTYTDEPFRAIDWQLQGMAQTGEKFYGTIDEWRLVAKRIGTIPKYLAVAQQQLLDGIRSGNTPDFRMLRRNGLDTTEANAKYFEATIPKLAEERIAGKDRNQLLIEINQASKQAAAAYRTLRDFIAKTFFEDIKLKSQEAVKPQFRGDRFVMGEEEYNWALKNNLLIEKNAATLYEEAWPIVEATRNEMITLAREIGKNRKLTLPTDGAMAVRAVFDELSKDYPKTDEEMIEWYRQTCFKLVEYGRKTGMFDIPADYKLDVTITPPPLQASIDGAAYYPAPPFKNSGVGRFYLTPTNNDEAALKSNNRASIADLAAHEGFPGHDWHYKVMTTYRNQISSVRWLTPGAVEDSSSMWQDSFTTEGWGLYAEALMAEPQPGAPNGFYTPEERLYQLQGKLYRDLRVRIDTGIHTKRMSYEEAVNLFSEIVDFLPGRCDDPSVLKNQDKRASCESSERAIFRYSKWPTQAITYRLGKDKIYELRKEAEKLLGEKFSAKNFHVLYMRQGTIPSAYFKEELLRQLQEIR